MRGGLTFLEVAVGIKTKQPLINQGLLLCSSCKKVKRPAVL